MNTHSIAIQITGSIVIGLLVNYSWYCYSNYPVVFLLDY